MTESLEDPRTKRFQRDALNANIDDMGIRYIIYMAEPIYNL